MRMLGSIVALIVAWTLAIVIVATCWWISTSIIDWAF